MSGVVVIVDEAHFLPRRSIENGPLAMLLQQARILMASTPPTGVSGIQTILDGKLPDGSPICTVVDFEFNCPRCKLIQIDHPEYVCTERFFLRPHIQDSESVMIMRAAYGPDSDAYKREALGSAVMGSHDFIPQEDIKILRETPSFQTTLAPHYVFISCDPSGSTKHYREDATSDYALVTAFIEKGSLVVKKIYFLFCFSLFMYSIWDGDGGGERMSPSLFVDRVFGNDSQGV